MTYSAVICGLKFEIIAFSRVAERISFRAFVFFNNTRVVFRLSSKQPTSRFHHPPESHGDVAICSCLVCFFVPHPLEVSSVAQSRSCSSIPYILYLKPLRPVYHQRHSNGCNCSLELLSYNLDASNQLLHIDLADDCFLPCAPI